MYVFFNLRSNKKVFEVFYIFPLFPDDWPFTICVVMTHAYSCVCISSVVYIMHKQQVMVAGPKSTTIEIRDYNSWLTLFSYIS